MEGGGDEVLLPPAPARSDDGETFSVFVARRGGARLPLPSPSRRGVFSCLACLRAKAGRGIKKAAYKSPVATPSIQKRSTRRVNLPGGPGRRKGAQRLGLERDAKI